MPKCKTLFPLGSRERKPVWDGKRGNVAGGGTEKERGKRNGGEIRNEKRLHYLKRDEKQIGNGNEKESKGIVESLISTATLFQDGYFSSMLLGGKEKTNKVEL